MVASAGPVSNISAQTIAAARALAAQKKYEDAWRLLAAAGDTYHFLKLKTFLRQ